MATTTRLSLRYPVSADTADVPRDIGNLASDIDKAAIFSKGTLAARPSSTVGSPGIDGRYYFATDNSKLYFDTGTSWVEIPAGAGSVSSSLLAAGATSATYETSLPGSPVDGQEIYYAADASAGVIWHLRYRSTSSSSYKWEFVGGPSLGIYDQSAASSTYSLTANTWTNIGGAVSVTTPLAGDYKVESSSSLLWDYTGTTASGVATSASGTPVSSFSEAAADNSWADYSGIGLVTGVAASSAITVRYRASGTTTARGRIASLVITPVRVG